MRCTTLAKTVFFILPGSKSRKQLQLMHSSVLCQGYTHITSNNRAANAIPSGAPPKPRRQLHSQRRSAFWCVKRHLKTSLSALPFRDNALFLRPSSPLRIKIAEKRRQQEEKENRKRAQKWGDNLHTRRKRFSALRAMNPNLANRFRDAHRLMTMRTGKITVRLAVLPAALV